MIWAGKILAGLSRWSVGGKPQTFSELRLRRRERFRQDYEIVAAALLRRVQFESMLDIGCANGFIMSELKRAGKTVAGIDVSPDVVRVLDAELKNSVAIGDFAQVTGASDLVCCVEVAEHIAPERSAELVSKLTSLARRWIYFTAAPPGQFGFAHINCRPHADWLYWFEAQGWAPEMQITSRVRNDLLALRKARWLCRNSFVLAPRTPVNGAPVNGSQRAQIDGQAVASCALS